MMEAVPAASLILFAEDRTECARHLMIKRIAKAAFAPNALVFPGGKVDQDDRFLAEAFGSNLSLHEHDDAASRVAAIRETLEETGVAVGIDPEPSAAQILHIRQGLEHARTFSSLLEECGATLRLETLVFFSRWCPNLPTKRRYDTRFFVALVDYEHSAQVNAAEASEHFWISAKDALSSAERGESRIVFPTLRDLERLARWPRFSDVLSHLESTSPGLISTRLETTDGEKFVTIPEGLGYPCTRYPVTDS